MELEGLGMGKEGTRDMRGKEREGGSATLEKFPDPPLLC